MLSKSAARNFFLIGTVLCTGAFLLLTLDTIRKVPAQTHQENITDQVKHGKELWEKSNCMGCHTLMGEGSYYAPELTKVYERRGAAFMRALIKDPEAMYPGQRRMQKYDFTDAEIDALIAFLKWVGEADLNGFPPKPALVQLAVPATGDQAIAKRVNRPQIYNQMCLACHSLEGQGGAIGPALDGIGARRNKDYIIAWLRHPQAVKPDAKMPKLPLTETDISELAAFLSELKTGGQNP